MNWFIERDWRWSATYTKVCLGCICANTRPRWSLSSTHSQPH